MKYFTTTSLFLLLTVLVFGQQTEKAMAYFDFGKHELTQQSKATIDNLLDKVKSKDVTHIELYGHTDNHGNNSFNKKLSQNRAITVRQYLLSKGISVDKIKIEYFGEEQPTANNENEDGKQKNRRVEIVIKVQQKSFSANREFIQTFKFSSKKEIVIKGKKGTIIRIPENVFVDTKGVTVTGEITIELIEIYTKSDMILNNIQTTSNQNLLETRGMIYIRAISKNIEVALKEDEFYTIEFPTKNKQKDMNIFYGDTSSKNINWQQAKRNFQSDGTYIENQKELNKYIFNSTKFGWINCDRFINQKETTDLIVNTTDTLGVNFCLVFKSINSVMNVSDRNGVIKFYNVPVGQTATLVAFKRTSQETFYSSKTVNLQKNQTIPITMEKLTEKEFKDKIKQLN